ncbi:hypothetical protein AJ80_00757 [Polytolypa hystricis UAMH7299]|uniref:SWR1-complex protein 4 n=1 Tax=Polytolypa hystricis (strain UAMH7299) TaxID=1447883 RepID=A0A2B7Z0Q9_POLH7|nr:hypothetical protein AJ80_00757 [Polytolypa hystricis UAMH7299]
MAAADVRDMLDLPAESQPRPAKKQKVVEKRPEGITRELYALLGERAPPIALNENKYKGRRKWTAKLKVRPWEIAPFTNDARMDGLVLRHWQRKTAPANLAPSGENAQAGERMDLDIKDEKEAEAYSFAKYNVKPQLPKRYTNDEYNRFLKSDLWSREETDYLMDLVGEFDLRWPVIADRYEYPPKSLSSAAEDGSTALVTATRRRTMEEMKARYYTVAANMLALEHPPSEMSEAEFDLHEKMIKYNPQQEKARKDLANHLFNRTKDEVAEESLLLEELKRITTNEKTFIDERKELYARLDAPISTSNTTMYQSSQGLSQLLQSLLQADKSKKRRSLLGPETSTSSPGSQPGTQNAPPSARESRPETPATTPAPSATNNRKSAATPAQPSVKTLTATEEARYGVTHHDRLVSGVQFRNDRAQKLTQAKSNIQSQKLAAALTELQIPPRLVMPTEKVCKEFEKLIQAVNLLLDARKVAEKVESEIRVLEAAKTERDRKEREKAEASKPAAATGDGCAQEGAAAGGFAEAQKPAETKAGDEVSTESKEGESANKEQAAPTTQGPAQPADATAATDAKGAATAAGTAATGGAHKRSASVLSAVSDKSTKKQKK